MSLAPLLAHVPVHDAAKRDVCRLMSGPDRVYHGVDHLVLLWQRHVDLAPRAGLDGAPLQPLIASAIAFHDAIYDATRHDNEERSAHMWLSASAQAPIAEEARHWVADTIRATRDHFGYVPAPASVDVPYADLPVEERARLWLLDLDLTPIGETEEVFRANTEMLRAENPRTDPAKQEVHRLAFLRRVAAQPRIYRSPVIAEAFEAQARRNLARELA